MIMASSRTVCFEAPSCSSLTMPIRSDHKIFPISFKNISDFEEIQYQIYAILRTVSMMKIENERSIASDFAGPLIIIHGRFGFSFSDRLNHCQRNAFRNGQKCCQKISSQTTQKDTLLLFSCARSQN